ncbi:YsnF/AvaK domain-containing protein [Methylorubrum thiocyanatum]|uniref:YsnF/AvaK domain-containing protein n=1 Tax=Methylorubrum thiocyanatum TaxID=47958 RepID=UPI00383A5E8C
MSKKPAVAGDADAFEQTAPQRHDIEEDLTVSELRSGEELVLPIVEETAHIEKRLREKGRVRVSTQTETINNVLRESLHGNTVGVSRVPIDRVIREGEPVPQTRTEGSVTIIPILEEVLVVEKRLILKEEVHIRETSTNQDVEVPVTLRKQRAVIERLGPEGAEPTTSTEETSHDADDHSPVR